MNLFITYVATLLGMALYLWFFDKQFPALFGAQERKESAPNTVTLASFLEDNQKLFSTLAVLVALTVFSGNVGIRLLAYVLTFLFATASLLVWLEIVARIPEKGSGRLLAFERVLTLATFALVANLILQYRDIWASFVFVVINIILLWIVFAILIRTQALPRFVSGFQNGKRLVRTIVLMSIVALVATVGVSASSYVSPGILSLLDEVASTLNVTPTPRP